ncbi:MAG: hypothetical protein ACT4OD_04225 [Candidatus Nitrosotenuis sp.]
MKSPAEKPLNLYLWLSLATVAIVVFASNNFGQEHAMFASDLLDIGIVIPMTAFSIVLVVKNGAVGNHGKAWIFFMTCIVLWTIAEFIWVLDELVFKNDPFPSPADPLWLVGYVAYLLFTWFYLYPFKSSISIKMICIAVVTSAMILGFTVYLTPAESSLSMIEDIIVMSYPVADAIVIAPTVIGISLFFRGQVSFSWLMLLIGTLCISIGDIGFQVLSQNDQYYSGHPVDIPYIWGYVFFIFGAYHHIRIFRGRNPANRFNDQEKLR